MASTGLAEEQQVAQEAQVGSSVNLTGFVDSVIAEAQAAKQAEEAAAQIEAMMTARSQQLAAEVADYRRQIDDEIARAEAAKVPAPAAPVIMSAEQVPVVGDWNAIILTVLAEKGYPSSWLAPMLLILNKESHGDANAYNPSGACGGWQIMSSQTIAGRPDCQTCKDPWFSTRWTVDYIAGRYGDPWAAWSYHVNNNSY